MRHISRFSTLQHAVARVRMIACACVLSCGERVRDRAMFFPTFTELSTTPILTTLGASARACKRLRSKRAHVGTIRSKVGVIARDAPTATAEPEAPRPVVTAQL